MENGTNPEIGRAQPPVAKKPMSREPAVRGPSTVMNFVITCATVLCCLILVLLRVSDMRFPLGDRDHDRHECLRHLVQIGTACTMYAMDEGMLPPDFEALHETQLLQFGEVYRCSESVHTFPEGPADFRKVQFRDYAYFGAGLKVGEADGKTIVAADQPGNHKSFFNILFGDGHVAGMSGASLEEIARREGLTLGKKPGANVEHSTSNVQH